MSKIIWHRPRRRLSKVLLPIVNMYRYIVSLAHVTMWQPSSTGSRSVTPFCTGLPNTHAPHTHTRTHAHTTEVQTCSNRAIGRTTVWDACDVAYQRKQDSLCHKSVSVTFATTSRIQKFGRHIKSAVITGSLLPAVARCQHLLKDRAESMSHSGISRPNNKSRVWRIKCGMFRQIQWRVVDEGEADWLQHSRGYNLHMQQCNNVRTWHKQFRLIVMRTLSREIS